MLCFSSQLNNSTYKPAADRLFAALDLFNIKYKLLNNTKDIWLRDFMPVKTRSGRCVSFRYEPSYLKDNPELKTDFESDILPQLNMPDLVHSDISLDGGNVVFSPSQKKVIISDRVFSENPDRSEVDLIRELENLLEAKVIIIPSLKSDMTGHADGMVRFASESTVLVNGQKTHGDFESKVIKRLEENNLSVIPMPYYETANKAPDGTPSAEGCYLNYLETENVVFFPVFSQNHKTYMRAISIVKKALGKRVIPLNVNEIALYGGLLNCISWEE